MSNTFNMSTNKDEGTVPLSHREVVSPEGQYSNLSLSPSPDSNSSISNLSETEASSSPDINMLECCLSDSSAVNNPFSTAAPQNNVFCGVSMNLNQTFIATPLNSSANFWNENLSVMSNHEMGSEKYQTFRKNTEDGSNSMVTSPDSAGRESRLSSDQTSRRGSTENDCCSLSSGEMILRSNSFCLDDQSLLVSSLEESSHPAIPANPNLLSTTLPDVLEKSTESVSEKNSSHPCLGTTFTHAAFPAVENDMATSDSLVSLPSEHEGGLLMTFVCETSPTDCGIEAQFSTAGAEPLPHSPVAFTPEQDKTFVDTLSATHHTNKVIHTSTPVQNNGNAMPSLPSFSESPCIRNAGSPGLLHPVKPQQISVSPNGLVLRLPPSAAKVKKMEIKKFPKSDFSSVKSKVVTRGGHQISASGPAAQHKPPQVSVNNIEARPVSISRAKLKSSTAVSTTKTVTDAQRRVSAGVAHLGVTVTPSSGQTAVDGLGKSGASPPHQHPAVSDHNPAVQCSTANSETEQVASSQVADATEQHSSSQNLCLSSLQKSPGQRDPKSSPKKDVLNKIEVRSGSALGQNKPAVLKTRPRCLSDSLSLSSRPPREKKANVRYSTSFTLPKADTHLGQTKPGNLNKQATQTEATNRPVGSSTREVKRISLVAESSKSTTTAASWDESKSKFQGRLSPRQTRAVPTAASPRPATLSTRPRQGTQGRDESRTRTVGTPQAKQRSSTGSQRVQAREPSLGVASTASIKPQLNGSRPPHTPTRTPLMGPPPTPSSRLPRKPPGPSRNLTEHMSEAAGSKQVYGGAAHKPSPLRSAVLKTRVTTTPGKTTGPSLTTACKPAAPISRGTLNSAVSHLKRTASAGLARLTPSGPVDKNKPKGGSHQQHPQHQASHPNQRNGPPDVVPASGAEGRRKDPSIRQLRGLLAASNCRFEATAIVLQQCLAERDEATKQCRDLSQELANLRGELVCSLHSSECLEKEKDELRIALEDALLKLQEQHQKDLAELEQRLQAFYQAEWDKVHLSYQEEADKCKALMQQQMGELKANHEAMKLELESSHAEQLQSVKQQYETSLEELNKVHSEELQSLDKTLKETGAALSGQIEALTVENNALIEKLTAEENRRKQLAEQSQKDSHTLYLEQELESLKVVLDIKNKQLHQQEKKLMEVDKLMEKNVKLDENLKKVQQENEDLKARMERHYALSRQLSTEQAVLQESLQKESKVNKRLSMENEELMWKLHNGDLSSPRKVSPTSTSPSRSFSLQSPRSSGMVSSPPVSPR